jgi:signal transduction histidine kinase
VINRASEAWRRLESLPHPWVDGALALALAAAQCWEFFHFQTTPLARLVGALLVSLPLIWRRRRPELVFVLQVVGSFLFLAPPLISSLVANFVGIYSLGVYSRRRALSLALPLLAGVILAAVGIPGHFYTKPIPAWVFEIVAASGLWLVGNSVRELDQRARRLDRERALAGQVATGEERARIARELHDVVAHGVSVMVVQAGAGRTLIERDPHRAQEAMRAVEAAGREALGELRRLLGVLGEEGGAGIAPQPGLDQLPDLVGRMRDAGLRVEVRVEGDPRPLPPGVDLSAYRVVQEALTNILKHASGSTAAVTLRHAEDGLEIEVINGDGTAMPGATGAGRGLVGMRERVAMHGGELAAGPLPDGGFQVVASLRLEDE